MSGVKLISCLMPIYNAEAFLSDAIESILNQSYKDFEFLICDDCSTDSSNSIVKKYMNMDDRIKLYQNDKNCGLVFSLNLLISKACGDFIARMDADDISLPHRFQKQIDLLQRHELDICGCHYFIINEYDKYLGCATVPLERNSIMVFLATTTPFAHPTIMARRDCFSLENLCYGKTEEKFAEDYSLWIKMWRAGKKFGNVDEFLFKYRHYSYSLSKKNKKEISNDKLSITKKYVNEYFEDIKNIINELNKSNNLSSREQDLMMLVAVIIYKYRLLLHRGVISNISNRSKIYGIIKYFVDSYYRC